jgi:hypothetical protein
VLVVVVVVVLVSGEAPPLAVPVVVELTVELEPAEGMKVDGGGVEAGPEVQAESATQASMVVRPQPTTVSRTRCDVHAMAVRALIEPPRVSAMTISRSPAGETKKTPATLTSSPSGWHKQAMACSPSEY